MDFIHVAVRIFVKAASNHSLSLVTMISVHFAIPIEPTKQMKKWLQRRVEAGGGK
jgi:hypothetical protein